jgi:UDP-N-acetylmuramyl pentapeptide synthase
VGALANANIGGDVQCASAEEAKTALAALLKPGDLVLLKASHGMHLELAI